MRKIIILIMLVEKIVRSLAFRVDTKSICVHSDEPDEQTQALARLRCERRKDFNFPHNVGQLGKVV